MTYLLDINVLLAAIWANHPQYAAADAWLKGKSVVVCPISELGFLRISTNRKAIAAPMADARKALEGFLRDARATRIADDLPALEARAENSEQVTDRYLATLAHRHGYRLATFDGGIKHAAVEVIECCL
jgi:toxin-antitoxin system PIN domain toxin